MDAKIYIKVKKADVLASIQIPNIYYIMHNHRNCYVMLCYVIVCFVDYLTIYIISREYISDMRRKGLTNSCTSRSNNANRMATFEHSILVI